MNKILIIVELVFISFSCSIVLIKAYLIIKKKSNCFSIFAYISDVDVCNFIEQTSQFLVQDLWLMQDDESGKSLRKIEKLVQNQPKTESEDPEQTRPKYDNVDISYDDDLPKQDENGVNLDVDREENPQIVSKTNNGKNSKLEELRNIE